MTRNRTDGRPKLQMKGECAVLKISSRGPQEPRIPSGSWRIGRRILRWENQLLFSHRNDDFKILLFIEKKASLLYAKPTWQYLKAEADKPEI